jgi:hypothetical protein
MMRFQFVRNYLFIFDNNDGRGREELGQIELSDDGEALAFGEQVIREMMQGSSRQYAGCVMGGSVRADASSVASLWRIIGSLSHHGTSALPHSEKLPRHDLDDSCFDMTGPGCPPGSLSQGGNREPSRSSFSARSHRIDEAGS